MHTSQGGCKVSTGSQHDVDLYGLTAPTSLYGLDLNTGRSSYPSLQPMYALLSMKSLKLVGGDSVHVTTELSSFCSLRRLVVTGVKTHGTGMRVQAKLAVQWCHMLALQVLLVKYVETFYRLRVLRVEN